MTSTSGPSTPTQPAASPPSSPPAAPVAPASLAAAQAALRGEHAAVWAYGVGVARSTDRQRDAARALLDAHRTERDALRAVIVRWGADPAPADAAYRLPFEVTDAAAVRRLLGDVEDRLAAVYADLAGTGAVGALARSLGVDGAARAGGRSATWRDRAVAFPGG